jgi:hypothetical protein
MQKNQRNYEAYLNLIAYKNAANEYIQTAALTSQSGHFEGYSYIFHFDETIANGPRYRSSHYGDQALLARDKKYALDKANYYHSQLEKKAMNPDKALAEIKADPQLGYHYAANTNDSSKFGTNPTVALQTEVFFPTVVQFINQQKQAGLSTIQTGKVRTAVDPRDTSSDKDGYYYFVLLTQADKTPENLDQKVKDKLKTVQLNSTFYGVNHA